MATRTPKLGIIPESAVVKIYLKSTTKEVKIVLNYPFLSAVADIGGYTGLLLGVSIVNITALLNQLAAKVHGQLC